MNFPGIAAKMIRDLVEFLTPSFIKKDEDQTTTGKITANGFDANGQRITNVGDATSDSDAMTYGQGKALAVKGAFLGKIFGYIRVVDSVVEFVHDADNDGVNEISSSPVSNQLYLLISNSTLGGNSYQQNDVVLFNGTNYICDNSLNTSDVSSASYDPEGAREGAEYIIKVNAEAGDVLPNYSTGYGGWGDGTRIKWNPEYDASGDDNAGRWEDNGSEASIPLATKSVAGVLKVGDGLDISGGVVSVALDDTDSPLSLTGTSPNKKIKFNFLTNVFTVASGVFGLKYQDTDSIQIGEDASGLKATLKDLAVTTAKLAARAVTFAKLPALTKGQFLGRKTAGSGDIEILTAAEQKAELAITSTDVTRTSSAGNTGATVEAALKAARREYNTASFKPQTEVLVFANYNNGFAGNFEIAAIGVTAYGYQTANFGINTCATGAGTGDAALTRIERIREILGNTTTAKLNIKLYKNTSTGAAVWALVVTGAPNDVTAIHRLAFANPGLSLIGESGNTIGAIGTVSGTTLTYAATAYEEVGTYVDAPGSRFAPISHTQAINTITGLQTTLDAKTPGKTLTFASATFAANEGIEIFKSSGGLEQVGFIILNTLAGTSGSHRAAQIFAVSAIKTGVSANSTFKITELFKSLSGTGTAWTLKIFSYGTTGDFTVIAIPPSTTLYAAISVTYNGFTDAGVASLTKVNYTTTPYDSYTDATSAKFRVTLDKVTADALYAALSHTHTASQITDFQTTVSANTDVAANTAARHTHANKALLDTYTQTEANLADAVSKKHAHANLAALDNVSGTNTGDQTAATVPVTDTAGNFTGDDVEEILAELAQTDEDLAGGIDTKITRGRLLQNFTPALTSTTNTTGYVDLTLADALNVTDITDKRSLINLYVNGVIAPQDTAIYDVLETVTSNGVWQVIRLKHAGIGFDLDGTDDVISIEVKD